jgi:hypothetical protein
MIENDSVQLTMAQTRVETFFKNEAERLKLRLDVGGLSKEEREAALTAMEVGDTETNEGSSRETVDAFMKLAKVVVDHKGKSIGIVNFGKTIRDYLLEKKEADVADMLQWDNEKIDEYLNKLDYKGLQRVGYGKSPDQRYRDDTETPSSLPNFTQDVGMTDAREPFEVSSGGISTDPSKLLLEFTYLKYI